MRFQGQVRKMITEDSKPIQYYMNMESDLLMVNQLLGKGITIEHDHNQCLNCNLDREIFRMGYCKSCFFEIPQTNESILRPELSKAHLGIEQRDLAWEQRFELQQHVVYLAVSSDLKVGVTRKTQTPTRWIDQGASSAIILAQTDNRYEAGLIEVALKEHVADKTNFRKMLQNEIPDLDLAEKKSHFKNLIPKEMQKFYVEGNQVWSSEFPVESYPQKVKSINLNKTPKFSGVLKGIKGQYWIFEDSSVWNVRSHEGLYINLEI